MPDWLGYEPKRAKRPKPCGTAAASCKTAKRVKRAPQQQSAQHPKTMLQPQQKQNLMVRDENGNHAARSALQPESCVDRIVDMGDDPRVLRYVNGIPFYPFDAPC